jgi:hypothetical protein
MLCQNVLKGPDDNRCAVPLAAEPVDEVGDEVVELLKQSFAIFGSFGYDPRLRYQSAAAASPCRES